MYFDVFNGDADGICALHQLRLAAPRPEAELITGVKRDIRLLRKIKDVRDGDITVLDISMESNLQEMQQLLAQGNRIFYVDHHFVGAIPDSSALEAYINPSPDICTALIVDAILEGRYRLWAIIGAFGDNLHQAAEQQGRTLSLSEEQRLILKEIGELFNYNGYGLSTADLHFPPQVLYEAIRPYSDPFAFYRQSPILAKLRAGYQHDMHLARNILPLQENEAGRIFKLPGMPWARRVSGVFSNEKARERPDLAHALLIENEDRTYLISVRAPLENKINADKLCRSFPTGGGRAAAAGINALPPEQLPAFLESFAQVFAR
jgi:hypothetical protein